jgi:hypothetical protein
MSLTTYAECSGSWQAIAPKLIISTENPPSERLHAAWEFKRLYVAFAKASSLRF